MRNVCQTGTAPLLSDLSFHVSIRHFDELRPVRAIVGNVTFAMIIVLDPHPA
jgi:hypothetical protein